MGELEERPEGQGRRSDGDACYVAPVLPATDVEHRRESTSDVRYRVHQLARRFDGTIERGEGLAPLRREAVDVANRLLVWSDDE